MIPGLDAEWLEGTEARALRTHLKVKQGQLVQALVDRVRNGLPHECSQLVGGIDMVDAFLRDLAPFTPKAPRTELDDE